MYLSPRRGSSAQHAPVCIYIYSSILVFRSYIGPPIKMEVIEPIQSLTSTSAYNVHLRYKSVTGDILYLKVDNMTNSVFLDKVRCYIHHACSHIT